MESVSSRENMISATPLFDAVEEGAGELLDTRRRTAIERRHRIKACRRVTYIGLCLDIVVCVRLVCGV